MITKENYIKANLKLDTLIKQLDLGENVDEELALVAGIIEEYEEVNYPIGMPKSLCLIKYWLFEKFRKMK